MTELSQPGREAFSRRMTDILNYGAINLAMAIGYQTGLFEAMASFSTPQPTAVIAARAGLHERYVREWLGIMVTGKVVELLQGEDELECYILPPEHAAFLTRSGGDSNLAVYTQEIPLLTKCAMEQVLLAFQSGAGVPYSCYPPFQAFMAELANAKHRQVLLEKFLPSVDGGQLLIRLEDGIQVCDLGCGEGVAMLLMAEAFPQSRFTGIDIDGHALEVARNGAASLGLKNTDFFLRDAAEIKGNAQWCEAFDYIVAFDAIHDQTAPQEALLSVHYMLAPGGVFSMVDIAAHTSHYDNRNHPLGPFLYTVSLMHCLPVGLVDGGAGLGMMWGKEQAVAMLQQAGFALVEVEEMVEDPFNLHFCCRK
jgi:2-polyprenyl-3-methyl-5-hydroxy-6-metoxy-1,4-benzoquinol methylase